MSEDYLLAEREGFEEGVVRVSRRRCSRSNTRRVGTVSLVAPRWRRGLRPKPLVLFGRRREVYLSGRRSE